MGKYAAINALSRQVALISSAHESKVKSWDAPALLYCTVDHKVLQRTSSQAERGDAREMGNNMLDAAFDQFIMRDEELESAVVGVFKELRLLVDLGVSEAAMHRLVRATMARYQLQPYHNFRHAFDVFQATYLLLVQSGYLHVASKQEVFTLLVTALLHDVGHVGYTNCFHQKGGARADCYAWPYSLLAKTQLASEGQVVSNESMHISAARELLFGQDGLFSGRDEKFCKEVDTLLEHLIHATDTVTQGAFLAQADARAQELSGPLGASDNPADRLVVLSLLLRVADVFHPMRPFHLHKRWAMSIAHEFALQGKVEEQLGQATSPLTNTDTYVSSLGGSTIGFMDFLVIPLVKRLEQALPPFPKNYICTLELNKLKWRTYDNMVCSRRSSSETPATFSAKTPSLSRAKSERAGGSLDLFTTVRFTDREVVMTW